MIWWALGILASIIVAMLVFFRGRRVLPGPDNNSQDYRKN